MTITAGIAIYFIMWWVVLFTVLPFGIRSQEEEGSVVPGSAPSAPNTLNLSRKVLWTTVVTTIVFAAFVFVYETGIIGLDDIPFLPTYEHS